MLFKFLNNIFFFKNIPALVDKIDNYRKALKNENKKSYFQKEK
ncbi:conserved hypothetical protein [Capnocytophaga canimorsus]|uniref:Uncharacterized protein n=1 Tax=Capnocytophaga canimorsus TaxID=28188 RepID=A0A0B7IQL5_9FLAO|nr:conserved hypothetical protein [Capnocytophaga canimorsus]CEN52307.1 conserved hypothetical protein [Capnocytophaga canimorsus]